MSIKVLATAYFSRHDTTTPVRYAVIAMVTNMAMNLMLIVPLGHIGLALATSLSAFVNAGLLLKGLVKREVFCFAQHWRRYLLQVIAANAAMVIVLRLLYVPERIDMWLDSGALARVIDLTIVCLAGAATYGLVLLATGVRPSHFRQKA